MGEVVEDILMEVKILKDVMGEILVQVQILDEVILEKVVGHTNGISNQRVKILDLASGPGEPAATMARALPKVSIDVLNGS